MRGVVEVPLLINNTKNVGTVLIDRHGRMKITMTEWVDPDHFRDILNFIRGFSSIMCSMKFSHPDDPPLSRRVFSKDGQ